MTRQNLSLLSLFALLIPLAIYLIWRPYNYSGDDLQQSISIYESTYGGRFFHPAGGLFYAPELFDEANNTIDGIPIQPRYLFEGPTSILTARLWRATGWQDGVITPVLTLRAIMGAVGALFIYLAVYDLRKNRLIALLCSLGMATTATYWIYSTHIDQSINMMAFIAIALYVLVHRRSARPSTSTKLIVAVILAIASFYNFTAVFTTIAFGLGIALMPQNLTLLQRVREFIIFCIFYGIIIVVTIAASVAILNSPQALIDPEFWQSVLFAGKPEYNIDILRDTFRAILGIAKSQVFYPPATDSLQAYWDAAVTTEKAVLLAYFGIVLAVLGAPFVVLIVRRRKLIQGETWLWVLLLASLLLHSIFNWFWDPGFSKYWLVPLFCLWITAALVLDHFRQTLMKWYRPALAVAVALVAVTFAVNFLSNFLPNSQLENSPWITISRELAETPETALFVSDSHPLDFHIAYFSRRNIVSAGLVSYSLSGDDIETRTSDLLDQHVARHRAAGGDVYLYSATGDIATLAEQVGAADVEVAWEFPDLTIYRVIFSDTA